MPRVFCGNFDFEHELAGPRGGREGAGQVVERVGSGLAPAWIGMAGEGDFVLAPEEIDPGGLADAAAAGLSIPRFVVDPGELDGRADLEFVPWGWSPSMAALAARHGWRCAAPLLDVVRRVNSREFRFDLECELGVSLEGAQVARSVEQLGEIVEEGGASPLGWLLKSNFGMAGRESLRGRGGSLSEPLANWARGRIAQVGCVVFEPFVDAVDEAGIQIRVSADGEPELLGVTPLLVDRGGTYRGSRFGCHEVDARPWSAAIDVGLEVAERLKRLGYFGPLGIDAMRYRDAGGGIGLRPLQDLNARHTMGRLALGLGRIVPPGWCATWLHVTEGRARAVESTQPGRVGALTPPVGPPPESGVVELTFHERLSALASRIGPECRFVSTSPATPGKGVAHRTALLLAASAQSRGRAEAEFRREFGTRD